MAAVKDADTRPELLIRSALHRAGFRYRLHAPDLPGRPDLVLRQHKAVIFVHGCFWHRHDCQLFRLPGVRREFWGNKLAANAERDLRVRRELRSRGWRIGVVWECSIRGSGRSPVDDIAHSLARWLRTGRGDLTVRGRL
jgi:DNA mismatch endonuclease (patch repair protein)